jgi:hypothetical protein
MEVNVSISILATDMYYCNHEQINTREVVIPIPPMTNPYYTDEYAKFESEIINALIEAITKRTDTDYFIIEMCSNFVSVKSKEMIYITYTDTICTKNMKNYKRDISGIKFACENFFKRVLNHVDSTLDDVSKQLNKFKEQYPYNKFNGHVTWTIDRIRQK